MRMSHVGFNNKQLQCFTHILRTVISLCHASKCITHLLACSSVTYRGQMHAAHVH